MIGFVGVLGLAVWSFEARIYALFCMTVQRASILQVILIFYGGANGNAFLILSRDSSGLYPG